MTAKRKRAAPIAMSWFAALQDATDLPNEYPGGVAVIAVAGVLMRYADADGNNCRPAIETIARKARVGERTARLVLAWLDELGWLAMTAKAKPRRPAVYRLTFPKVAEEPPWDDAQRVPRSILGDVPKVVAKVAAKLAEEPPDLLPPNLSEEEDEGASAPFADAPGAAPLPVAERVSMDSLIPIYVDTAMDMVVRRARVSIDTERVGPAMRAAIVRTGWQADVVAVHCIEKLRANRGKVRDPSEFLVTDLGRVHRGITPSPRGQLAGALARLNALDMKFLADADDDDDYDGPLGRAETLLTAAKLLGADDAMPKVWDFKPDDIEAVIHVIDRVIAEWLGGPADPHGIETTTDRKATTMRTPIHTILGPALSPNGYYHQHDGLGGTHDFGFMPPANFVTDQPPRIPVVLNHVDADERGHVVHIERSPDGVMWIVAVSDLDPPGPRGDDRGFRHWSVGTEGRQTAVDERTGHQRRIVLQHASIQVGTAASNTGPLVWMPFDVRDELPNADADLWRFRGDMRPMLTRAHDAVTRRQHGEPITIVDVTE